MCDENDINTLFTIGVSDTKFTPFTSAVLYSPPSGGTEDSFISFWDDNIRKIVELLVPSGRSIRNSNRYTETKKLRPDLGFLLDTACPFRGEEKGPEDTTDPKAELVDKLVWVYNPAPYMLGKRPPSVIFSSLNYLRRLLLPRIRHDPLRHYCT